MPHPPLHLLLCWLRYFQPAAAAVAVAAVAAAGAAAVEAHDSGVPPLVEHVLPASWTGAAASWLAASCCRSCEWVCGRRERTDEEAQE